MEKSQVNMLNELKGALYTPAEERRDTYVRTSKARMQVSVTHQLESVHGGGK